MTRPDTQATVRMWVTEPPSKEVQIAVARLRRSDDVQAIAVMPDVHLAAEVCVGVVTATARLIYPEAVGGDIGCGMAAVAFEADAAALSAKETAARILRALGQKIPVLKHIERKDIPDHLANTPLSSPNLERIKHRDASVQLGTIGRGNHFVEFQADHEGRLWLMIHSGSRGVGPIIRDHHLRRARRSCSGLWYLDADAADGQGYLNDMRWALRYAEANRQVIMAAVIAIVDEILGAHAVDESAILCHHNHIVRESIGGRDLWLHRKGAISAQEGELGIIPGSMGSSSYHVKGRGCDDALLSSSHGAGRAMSRLDARRSVSLAVLEEQMNGVWFDHRRAERLVDEAPGAYKNITKVMKAQRDLTRAIRKLNPVLSYKGA